MNCKNCGNELKGRWQKIFCSHSCAATFNNVGVRRHGIMRSTICECGEKKYYISNLCFKCKNKKSREMCLEKPIGKIPIKSRLQTIRGLARLFLLETKRPKKCKICGYDKHVNVCHIKPISSFLETDSINKVNNIENLEYYCPNHHWEFDHGLLM